MIECHGGKNIISNKYVMAMGFVVVLISAYSFDASRKGLFMKNYYQAFNETDTPSPAPLRWGSKEEKKDIDAFTVYPGTSMIS